MKRYYVILVVLNSVILSNAFTIEELALATKTAQTDSDYFVSYADVKKTKNLIKELQGGS